LFLLTQLCLWRYPQCRQQATATRGEISFANPASEEIRHGGRKRRLQGRGFRPVVGVWEGWPETVHISRELGEGLLHVTGIRNRGQAFTCTAPRSFVVILIGIISAERRLRGSDIFYCGFFSGCPSFNTHLHFLAVSSTRLPRSFLLLSAAELREMKPQRPAPDRYPSAGSVGARDRALPRPSSTPGQS